MDRRYFPRIFGMLAPALLVLALVLAAVAPAAAQEGGQAEAPQWNAEGGQQPSAGDSGGAITAKVEQTPSEAPPSTKLPREKQPVRVTSDRMVYNEKAGTVSFVGNVTAVHSGLTLTSKTITAFFATEGKGVQEIDRIVAEGDVRAVYGTTVGTSKKLIYTVADGVLRMEGDPVLQDGPNTVTGEVIKFYLKDNRSEVIGGKGGQVEAVFTLPEDVKAP